MYTMVLSVTMDEYKKSLDVMRGACQPKFPKLPAKVLDDFRTGIVPEDIPKDLKVKNILGDRVRLTGYFIVLCEMYLSDGRSS